MFGNAIEDIVKIFIVIIVSKYFMFDFDETDFFLIKSIQK